MSTRSRRAGAAAIVGLALSAIPLRTAEPQPAVSADTHACLIDASARVRLSAPVQGVVERVLVDRGARVKAGQIVVEMESKVEKAQLALARARAANGEPVASAEAKRTATARAFERFQRLKAVNPGAVTEVKYDEAEADWRVAEANLRDAMANLDLARLEAARAEAALEQRIVRATIDGVVTERAMLPGEYRNEQAYFLTIATVDPLYVEVYLPVALYTQVHVGEIATVRPAAPIGGERKARVIVVDPVIDAPSSTFGVRLELSNPNYDIPAGLRCTVKFG